MNASAIIFLPVAALLFGIGAHALVTQPHLLRKVLAVNLCTTAVFLVLVTLGGMGPEGDDRGGVDPVPHAMVLTGIVVALSTTAVALALIVRLPRRR